MSTIKKDSLEPINTQATQPAGNGSQSFSAIGHFEATGGFVKLIGRNGQRDKLMSLRVALTTYVSTLSRLEMLVMHGIPGWQEQAEILEEFGVRIKEAAAQCAQYNEEVPQPIKDFIAILDSSAVPSKSNLIKILDEAKTDPEVMTMHNKQMLTIRDIEEKMTKEDNVLKEVTDSMVGLK
jgi:hypothetical protein